MPNSPKVVIFDLGKVLVDFDYAISARKIAAKSNCSAAEVQKLIDHSPLLFSYETGQIDKSEFYRQVCKLTGYRGRQEEFEPEFSDIFSEIEPTIRLHAELRKAGLPTYILSNTNDMAVGHIRRTFPFFSNFDAYILSFEQKVMKPHAGIYENAERIIGHRARDIVYIDDRLENLAPAALRNWQVIHHRSPDQTISALKTLGFKNNL
jgi:putative hydrolase of the HAD superfamily